MTRYMGIHDVAIVEADAAEEADAWDMVHRLERELSEARATIARITSVFEDQRQQMSVLIAQRNAAHAQLDRLDQPLVVAERDEEGDAYAQAALVEWDAAVGGAR